MVSGSTTKRASTSRELTKRASTTKEPGPPTPEPEPDQEALDPELQQVRQQLVEAALAGQELVERNHQLQEQLQEKVDQVAEAQQLVEKERRRAKELDRAVQEARERSERAADEKAAAEAKVRLLDDASQQQVSELLGMSQQLEELTREKRERERQAEKSRLTQEAEEWKRRESVGQGRRSKADGSLAKHAELVEENKMLRVKFAACRWMYVAGASLRQEMQEELDTFKITAKKAQQERDGKAAEVQELERTVQLEKAKAQDLVQEQEQLLKERSLLRKQTRDMTADREEMLRAREELQAELAAVEAKADRAETDAKSFVVALQEQQGQGRWQRAFRKVQRSGQRASTEPAMGNTPIVSSPTRQRRTVNFADGEGPSNLLDELEQQMTDPSASSEGESEDEAALSARAAAEAAQLAQQQAVEAARKAEEQAAKLEAERRELAEHRRVVEEQVQKTLALQQAQVEQQIAQAVQQRVKAELDSAVEVEKAKWVKSQVPAVSPRKHFAWNDLEDAEQAVRTFRVENALNVSTHGVRYRLSMKLEDGDPDLKQYAPWDSLVTGKVSSDGDWLAVQCGGVEKFVPVALQGQRILKEVHPDAEPRSPSASPRPAPRARTRLRRAGVNAATLLSLQQANARAEELPAVVVPIPELPGDEGRPAGRPSRGRAPSQSRSPSPEVSPRSSRSQESPGNWARVKKACVDTSALEAMGIPVDKYQRIRKSMRPT